MELISSVVLMSDILGLITYHKCEESGLVLPAWGGVVEVQESRTGLEREFGDGGGWRQP